MKPSVKNFLLLLLSALCLSLPFLTGWAFLTAWAGLVPLFILIRNKRKLPAFLYSLAVGVIFYLVTIFWITTTLIEYGGIHPIPAFLINALLALYLALYFALFGLIFSWISTKKSLTMALIISPFLWVVMEFLRSVIITGFPWNMIAYSQYKILPVIQLSELTGAWGVSWLVVAGNAYIFHIIRKRKSFAIIKPEFFVYPLILMIALVFGIIRTGMDYTQGTVKVSLIQGNTQFKASKRMNPYQNALRHVELIKRKPSAELAILSESSLSGMRYVLEGESLIQSIMKTTSDEGKTDILYGIGTYKLRNRKIESYYNSAVLTTFTGNDDQFYHKQHLVPFGEYVPLRKILSFVNKFSKFYVGDTSAGEGTQLLETSGGVKIGVGICYEIIFPDLMRRFARDGAQLLVTITNDTWYGESFMPGQHFVNAVFRAVENRKSVARAANSGISGFIDPRGIVLDESGLFETTVLAREIPINNIRTVYSLLGDWFVLLSLIVVACSLPRKKKSS